MIKTVLGKINKKEITSALCHEHICCYSEYLFMMSGRKYLDKGILCERAVSELISLRENYGINLFVDCTPVNTGRDIELLKRISEKSGVHIVASTGFYYTRECVLERSSAGIISEHLIYDAENTGAGVIKTAVEYEDLNYFDEKMLKATALAHFRTGLPIVLHTNAKNGNGERAVEIMTDLGVCPQCITVAHLSDCSDIEYILRIAKKGCYIGLDRMCNDSSDEYISKKLLLIKELCESGFEDKILLSHDELIFSGFDVEPVMKEKTGFCFVHKYILPRMDKELADKISRKNVIKMLACGK